MSNSKSITTNEKQILKLYTENLDYLSEENDLFLSKEGSILFKGLLDLQKSGESFNKDSWLKYSYKHGSIKESDVSFVSSTTINVDDFPHYLSKQREDFYCSEFESNIMADLIEESGKKSKDVNKIEEILSKGEELLSNIKGSDYKLSSIGEIIDRHRETLKERLAGDDYLTTGDKHLDSILSYPFAPGEITVIGASSGIGKTTFSRHLQIKRIVKRLPTLSFSLEMSEEAFADPTVSSLGHISERDLMGHEDAEGGENIPTWVLEKVDTLYKRYKDHKSFYFCDESVMSISELKITAKRKLAQMPKSNFTPVIFIDLMSMLSDFNGTQGSMASVYERAINRVHSEIARSLNVHVVAIFQLKRPSDKVKIECYDDIFEKLKPSPETLKNSGAIFERARSVMLLFRPKHYGLTYLGEKDPEVLISDDVMYIYLDKQNRGKLGKVMYLCDFDRNKLTPYFDDEQIDLGDE